MNNRFQRLIDFEGTFKNIESQKETKSHFSTLDNHTENMSKEEEQKKSYNLFNTFRRDSRNSQTTMNLMNKNGLNQSYFEEFY